MTKITILGAGITGMTIALGLPKGHDVTIVAEHLPGDYHTKEWASPWAGAIWVGVHASRPAEQAMQLEGFAGLWEIAAKHPESGARRIEMTEIMDRGTKDDVWYAGKVPGFRFLDAHELPDGAIYGMNYWTVVLTPQVFLLWLYERLKEEGVKFLRARVDALSDLEGLGHDVLVNASGFGSERLRDVLEQNLKSWRLQCVVAKNDTYNKLFIRRGPNGYYSTAFSRRDGTVYVGGVLSEGSRDATTVSAAQRASICKRAHENQPDVFPSPDPNDWPILYDHVGIFPVMDSAIAGVRCERTDVGEQRVIHAYGQNAGGYVYSFGLARAVVNLVHEATLEIPSAVKL